MDIEAVFLDIECAARSPEIGKIIDLLGQLEIKVAVVCNNIQDANVDIGPRCLFEFIITPEDVDETFVSSRLFYEAQWRMNLKRKEALVITTSKEAMYCASNAFCRSLWLESPEELTVSKLDEILCSTKYGL
jgi:hypothetical protein